MAGWDDSIFGNLPQPYGLPGSPWRPQPPPPRGFMQEMLPVDPAEIVGQGVARAAGQPFPGLAPNVGLPNADLLGRDVTGWLQSPSVSPRGAGTMLAAAPLAATARVAPELRTAEEIATGVRAAPSIITRANPTQADIDAIMQSAAATKDRPWPTAQNPIFDQSMEAAQRTTDIVPQVSRYADIPRPDPGDKLPLKGRVQQIIDARKPLAARIAGDLQPMVAGDDPMLHFYSTAPIIEQMTRQGVLSPEEANQFMRDWAGQGAATSPQTTTPRNLKNASYLLWKRAIGQPVPSEAEGWTPAMNEPGYPLMGTHANLGEQFATGTENINQNPKPTLFRDAWSGNVADVVADTHNLSGTLYNYDQLYPGQLHPSWFVGREKGPAYQAYKAAGGFPTGEVLPDKTLDLSPEGVTRGGVFKRTEYGPMADPWFDAANQLGIAPGQGQSGGWFHYGPITGLKSPPATIPMLLNNQIEHTSRVLGVSPEHVLDWFARRKIPLAQNTTPGMTLNTAVG